MSDTSITEDPQSAPAAPPPEPPTYKVIAISMYLPGIAAMDASVDRCKAAGLTRMSRSKLIRIALAGLDVDALIAAETERPR
jgi:hypothetical protein